MDRVQFPYIETPVSSYGNSGFSIWKLEFLYSETGVSIAGNCASHITYRYVLVITSNFVCYNGIILLNIIQSNRFTYNESIPMPVVICRCLQKYVSMYLSLTMQIILIQMHI